MTACDRHPRRMLRAAAATVLVGAALAATGCGGSGTKIQPPPPVPTPAQLERSASAERKLHIDEIVGEYLSELSDSPAAADDPRAIAVTTGQLGTEAATAPAPCAKALAAITALVNHRERAGASKRDRVKASLATVDSRC